MYKYVALCILVASALAVPAPENEAISQSLECAQHDDDMLSCLAIKAIATLNRAARSSDVKLVEGVAFVRDSPADRSGKSLKSEKEMYIALPRDGTDKTVHLATMLYDSALSFFKSHSLKINVPEGSVSRTLNEDDLGRAKIKKMILPLVAAAGVKIFALVPILLGGLALLVAKALFIGKIALLVAGVLAFNRLFAGSSVSSIGSTVGTLFGKNPSGQWYDGNQAGWSASTSNQQGYYRSFGDKPVADVAQQLAYSAQAPSATNETN